MNKKISLKFQIIGWFMSKKYQWRTFVKRVKVAVAVFKATKNTLVYLPVLKAIEPLYPNQVESSRFYHKLLTSSKRSSEEYKFSDKKVTLTFWMEE